MCKHEENENEKKKKKKKKHDPQVGNFFRISEKSEFFLGLDPYILNSFSYLDPI